jgi:hypothetical protein
MRCQLVLLDTRMVEKQYGHLAPSHVAEAIRAAAPKYGIKADRKSFLWHTVCNHGSRKPVTRPPIPEDARLRQGAPA